MKNDPLKNRETETGDQAKAAVPKKRRLKYIAVLPSFITLINGTMGFMSIVLASRGSVLGWTLPFIRRSYVTSFTVAGYMILFAMLADMLDGRVARLTRTTSSFGGQLDSLCDALSFGAAPAFLMIKLMEIHLDHLRIGSQNLSMLLGRAIFFSAILYVACAIVRLARFNVENEEDEAAHMSFSGIPTPAAAGVLVSLVIFHQQFLSRVVGETSEFYRVFEIISLAVFPLITLLTGVLMVSRISYPHLANQLLRRKKTLPSLLAIFASGILIIWNINLALIVGFCGFALYGIFRWLFGSLLKKRPPKNQDAVQK